MTKKVPDGFQKVREELGWGYVFADDARNVFSDVWFLHHKPFRENAEICPFLQRFFSGIRPVAEICKIGEFSSSGNGVNAFNFG